MKAKKYLTPFIYFLVFIVSCTPKLTNMNNGVEYFWNPPNSISEKVSDQNGISILFQVPDQYAYLGLTDQNETFLKVPNQAVLRCICSQNPKTANCEPMTDINFHYYCGNVTIDCGKCMMMFNYDKYQIKIGGYIIPSLGISFANKNENLPYAFKLMANYPEFKKQIHNFLLKFYPDIEKIPEPLIKNNQAIAPLGHDFVVLNAFGRAFITIIPEGLSPENSIKSKNCVCSYLQPSDLNEICIPYFNSYYLHCAKSEEDGMVYKINVMANNIENEHGISYQSYSF